MAQEKMQTKSKGIRSHLKFWDMLRRIHIKRYINKKNVYRYTDIRGGYDAIVVCSSYSYDIYSKAKVADLDLEKFIFMYPGAPVYPDARLEWKREILGEKVFQIYLGNYNLYETNSFYEQDKIAYAKANKRPNFEIKEEYCWPIVRDKYEDAGTVDNYFLQDLWAAKLIHEHMPKEHYDIGSRLDGFIAHILSFSIPVHMIDVRSFPCEVEGLDTIVADATELKEFADESIESLSALCSLEHFGLGRYGDPIDPEACFKCFGNIQKKLKRKGHLYIALPVGKERVEFNAHRVFFASTVKECFNKLELLEYSCAAEEKIEYNVPLHKYDDDNHNGNYRYGLFHFVKK